VTFPLFSDLLLCSFPMFILYFSIGRCSLGDGCSCLVVDLLNGGSTTADETLVFR
jgi:hypothetical protein